MIFFDRGSIIIGGATSFQMLKSSILFDVPSLNKFNKCFSVNCNSKVK